MCCSSVMPLFTAFVCKMWPCNICTNLEFSNHFYCSILDNCKKDYHSSCSLLLIYVCQKNFLHYPCIGVPVFKINNNGAKPPHRREDQGKLVVKNFLKPLLKMPSIFCEFGCYNRKLCVNKTISFFSDNTGPNVSKKITHQQLK